MLETEMKKLTESITALTTTIHALHASMGTGLIEALAPVVTLEQQAAAGTAQPEDTTMGPEGVKTYIGEITRPELGAYLAETANKFGTPAQDAIKAIILETGGTQALSQVDDAVLGIIKEKVVAWVAQQA